MQRIFDRDHGGVHLALMKCLKNLIEALAGLRFRAITEQQPDGLVTECSQLALKGHPDLATRHAHDCNVTGPPTGGHRRPVALADRGPDSGCDPPGPKLSPVCDKRRARAARRSRPFLPVLPWFAGDPSEAAFPAPVESAYAVLSVSRRPPGRGRSN